VRERGGGGAGGGDIKGTRIHAVVPVTGNGKDLVLPVPFATTSVPAEPTAFKFQSIAPPTVPLTLVALHAV
jgi:hypothetical protein